MKERRDHTRIGILLRGAAMGVSDIIPGVSGGTIAFITGIYERFIDGLRDAAETPAIWAKQRRLTLAHIDWQFFIPLLLGLAAAFWAGSKILPPLLEAYPGPLYAFFVGLILASTHVVYRRIPRHGGSRWAWAIPGLAAGILVSAFAISLGTGPIITVGAGFIAISAMLLPGISGSYILLILGQYERILHALDTYDLTTIGLFSLGAILGLAALSHLLAHLLREHESRTLFFLAGLMVGALQRPVRTVLESTSTATGWVLAAGLTIIGAVMVLALERQGPLRPARS